ncbi:MAG: DNA gyrase inhibitor YacG [Nitrospirae bacterium]|nr:DNA gyrase inhibitor YacG [Nitrospirota bacterium]
MPRMICPLCHQSSTWEGNPWRPFCSERCQLTDLGTWAAEEYRIPGPTILIDTSLPDSVEGNDDTEAQRER